MNEEKITLVMSRSAFVSNNRDHMERIVEQSLAQHGYVYLTEVAENFNYLNAYEIKNWDEIKHTIHKMYIAYYGDGDIASDDCEVSFDWNKYEIKWEE